MKNKKLWDLPVGSLTRFVAKKKRKRKASKMSLQKSQDDEREHQPVPAPNNQRHFK
jgi:hypothetical protein